MFHEIIGNDDIKEMLEQSVKLNKTSHSYLFVGIEGIGKKLFAIEFAKILLCAEETGCGKCKSCIEFLSNNNPDFFFIEPDGNSIKIEQIRNMQKTVQEKPIISKRKVYIIDNANLMTIEAQNCLLKTLEEPPEYVTIILIGSNETDFLSTIKSRCMIIKFKGINNNVLREFLKQKYGIENISENRIETFQGSIGKAIELKDKQELYTKLEQIVSSFEKMDLIDVLNNSQIIYQSKDEIFDILDYMNLLFFKMIYKNEKYINAMNIVEDTKIRISQNSNYDISIDNMLFCVWEELNEKYNRGSF